MKLMTGRLPSKDLLITFLPKTNLKKYSGWPNVNKERVSELLFNNVKQANHQNVIFVIEDDEIISLLSYSFLEWDTNHFGFKTAKIDYLLIDYDIDISLQTVALQKTISSFISICKEKKYRFVSVDVSSQDYIVADIIQKAGFHYIISQLDGFVKDKYQIDNNDDVDFGLVTNDEIEKYVKIASTSYFKGGRFYTDYQFNKAKVDQMYANLVKNSYQNGEIMLSYRYKGEPVGLFICKNFLEIEEFEGMRIAPLRFLVIDPLFRGKNISTDLFKRTVNYLLDRCDIVTTGLEYHNMPSLNLHSKLKFKFNYTHNVYHWWNQNLTK